MQVQRLFSRLAEGGRLMTTEKLFLNYLKMTECGSKVKNLGILTRDDFALPHGSLLSTFYRDEHLEKLPLPKLGDTLEKYYKSLLPFGSEKELQNSRRIIKNFQNGVGMKLHKMLEEKAAVEKNWVEKLWEKYAYLKLRDPPAPTQAVVQSLLLDAVGIETNSENRLKNLARIIHYAAQFYDLIRKENLLPSTNPDGSVIFSSDQFRRLFNTSRIPGEKQDRILNDFRTFSEGKTFSPTLIILGNGKVFYFDVFGKEKLFSEQEIFYALSHINERIKNNFGDDIPLLTCDERTNWAKNRKHLIEISTRNAQWVQIIESSMMAVSLDENEPENLSEICIKSLDGDYNSRWMDKSIMAVAFKNGKFGILGEHTCYDGPVFTAFSNFILACFNESQEPDWKIDPKIKIFPHEIKFDVDEKIKFEVKKARIFTESFRGSVNMKYEKFSEYGKAFMKQHKVHPDSYVQMALQLAYFKIHQKLAPTYESATMRAFYHGRTETVRSCSFEVKEWIDKMSDGNASTTEKAKLFKEAANSQYRLMNEARKGNGIDRHLFGLWCIAREKNIPIPEFYDDPLYAKSGGGGNFVLSTSTLGYTVANAGMAPMTFDGYGTFYSMLNDGVWLLVSSFRDSRETSCENFFESFESAMYEIKKLLESSSSKL